MLTKERLDAFRYLFFHEYPHTPTPQTARELLTHIAEQDKHLANLRAECRAWRGGIAKCFVDRKHGVSPDDFAEANDRIAIARRATDADKSLEGE